MMPNPGMMPPPGAGAPPMGGGPAGGEGGPNPEMIKGEIVKMLKEARRVAEQAGLNWEELIQGTMAKPSVAAPRMPASPVPPPDM